MGTIYSLSRAYQVVVTDTVTVMVIYANTTVDRRLGKVGTEWGQN
jgi:hypothetical protein